jgi:pyruvate,water dikinase
MSEYIIGLDELGLGNIGEAGSKGALLGELLSRDFPVPKGYCLTVLAYDNFLQLSGIGDAVNEAHALPPEGAIEASQQIQARIAEAAIPADVAVTLSTLYRSLGQRPRVAVRPSPAYDDQLRNPVAGQIAPHLNVLGEKDLFQAVRETWASVWQPQVLMACQRLGLDHARLKPAVIMQVMVHPVASGTIFTADPVTGERDRLLITASWGMGQGSTGGQATPDAYHVDRVTRALRFKRIVTKDVMVSASGIVPVPKNRRNTVVLKDPAIRELCTIALGIEEIMHEPAEVEWCAVASGQLMVLEALPVRASEDLLSEAPPVEKTRAGGAPEWELPEEETLAEESLAEESLVEESLPEEPLAEEPLAEEPPAEEPPAEEPAQADEAPRVGERELDEPEAEQGDGTQESTPERNLLSQPFRAPED